MPPYGSPHGRDHLKKTVASCFSDWECLLRMLWGLVDTELPFISQDTLGQTLQEYPSYLKKNNDSLTKGRP